MMCVVGGETTADEESAATGALSAKNLMLSDWPTERRLPAGRVPMALTSGGEPIGAAPLIWASRRRTWCAGGA